MQLRNFVVAAIAAQALLLPVWGHHSHGNYQMTEYTHLTGTVKEFHLINPHAWVHLEVEDAGQTAVWVLEAAGSSTLGRIGVTQDSLKPGDAVTVRCHQLRDGSNGCLLGFLTPEGGTELEWD